MIRTKLNPVADSGWDVAFWFAVLSPVIGVLVARPGSQLVLITENTIKQMNLKMRTPRIDPARNWREKFQRRWQMHDRWLVLNMAIFNFDGGWNRTFNPLKARENVS
jgi:hypothetical protein